MQFKLDGLGTVLQYLASQFTQDHLRGHAAHLAIGDLYRRQGRITGLRHIRIIETGDGQLIAFLPVLGDLGFANTTFSDADFGVVGILLGLIVR
ncbi:putative SgaT/UlaA family sugar-specific permease [Aeromonas encheleia]|nr:putative SgaT/UlaA family sugar-specific permease [Aeromonas encheleia]